MQYLEEIRDYWNKRAKGYFDRSARELSSNAAEFWSVRLFAHLPKNRSLKCLDIGCGPGFLGILLAKMGHAVTLSDVSPKMLEMATINAKHACVRCEIKCTDAQHPDFEQESFDIIVNRNLVWNLENPELAYKKWLNLLKTNGKLLVFDGNHYLHQYNETYKERKSTPEYTDPHTQEVMQGVDPNIMAEIAQNLPLSRYERPYWDMEFFLKQKVTSVQTNPLWTDFIGLDGEKKSVIEEFMICIEK